MSKMTIAVIGAGTMGNGIAQVAATSGFPVYLIDKSEEQLAKAKQNIEKSLDRLLKKEKISASDKEETLKRLQLTTDLAHVKEAGFVIEAVFEQLDLKRELFRQIDQLCPPETIIGSNTSSLPITAIAASTKRPDKVIGTHFMNPVPVMPGVELIKARQTSEETVAKTKQLMDEFGKISVVAEDYAGFIVSRLLNIYLNEAAYCVMDGNDPEEIDKAMVHCSNMPMGPCRLMDLVGIDIIVYVTGILEEEFGPRFKTAPLLKQMARAGELGVKTGKGFYQYS